MYKQNSTPANWVYSSGSLKASDKGAVKAEGLFNTFTAQQIEFIAHNSATIVAFANSEAYRNIIRKSKNAKKIAELEALKKKQEELIRTMEEELGE